MIAPTSDKALPRPVKIQVKSENLASHSNVKIRWLSLVLNILKKSAYSLFIISSVSIVIEIIIGKIIIICAKIIIFGVYSISKKPNGPLFENNIYNTRPTKTGGKAIKELKKSLSIFLPKKFFTAKKADTGKAIIVDIINATIDTFKERSIISYRSSSNEKIRFNDWYNISTKS